MDELVMLATNIARGFRLLSARGYYKRGFLTEAEARTILSGPLVPEDPSTFCDDSGLLHAPASEIAIILFGGGTDERNLSVL